MILMREIVWPANSANQPRSGKAWSFFGRETGLPQHVAEPLVPPGKVEIGPAKVEGYLPAISASPPPDQAKKN
jgi:hypothetical protein